MHDWDVALLAPKQQQFASAFAAQTGLNPRVVSSWLLAEQSGSAAKFYEGKGYNNWLNIARTDSGDAGGAHSGVWSNPASAAKASAEWIKGQGQIAHEYGKPAAGIMSILHTAGKGPQEQIKAIAGSGWASSGYNGGSTLTQLYSQLGGERLPAAPQQAVSPTGLAHAASTASTTTSTTAPSSSETEALSELLSKVKQVTAKPNLAAQASPSRPEAFAQPTLPVGAATPPPITPKAKSSSNLLPLVEQVLASAAPSAETSTTPAAPAQLGTQAPAAGSPASALTSRKGIVDFNGTKVAAWIAPILHYVQAHGVTPELSSGYRSKAEQTRIYDSGVRPAAVPGTSNHEGEQFPRGAVDIKNAQAVDKVLSSSPYSHLLVYAGEKDPVHFSHPHNGGY